MSHLAKRLRQAGFGLVAGALVAMVAANPTAGKTPADAAALLSGVEYIAPKALLDDTIGPTALTDLIAIARGETEDDPGLRIRAYRALALYTDTAAQNALIGAVTEHRAIQTGVESLYLRAAVESLAVVGQGTAVPFITPLLHIEANLDTRVAAARALSVCGSPAALPALRERLDIESQPQVRLAISDAIRDLTGL